MSHIPDHPIPPPILDAQERPASFRWKGQVLHVVEILDCFLVTGRWWEQEPEQVFWRIRVRGGGIYELTHAQDKQGQWRLYRYWD